MIGQGRAALNLRNLSAQVILGAEHQVKERTFVFRVQGFNALIPDIEEQILYMMCNGRQIGIASCRERV